MRRQVPLFDLKSHLRRIIVATFDVVPRPKMETGGLDRSKVDRSGQSRIDRVAAIAPPLERGPLWIAANDLGLSRSGERQPRRLLVLRPGRRQQLRRAHRPLLPVQVQGYISGLLTQRDAWTELHCICTNLHLNEFLFLLSFQYCSSQTKF